MLLSFQFRELLSLVSHADDPLDGKYMASSVRGCVVLSSDLEQPNDIKHNNIGKNIVFITL
jgi:hypothetical protein